MHHTPEQMLTFARMLQIYVLLFSNALHITLDKVNMSSNLLYIKLPWRVTTSITTCTCGVLSQAVEIGSFPGWATIITAEKK